MSNVVKDCQMNIPRADRVEAQREKSAEGGNMMKLGVKIPQSSSSPLESTFNVSEPSIFHDELIKMNVKSDEDYARSYNQKTLELSLWKSELNSSFSDQKNLINFFSLPKFGLCEKATQTNLSSRDIDDLEYFQKELGVFRSDLMSLVLKSKSNELIKKLFPNLDDKKLLGERRDNRERDRDRDLTLSINEPKRKENFININPLCLICH